LKDVSPFVGYFRTTTKATVDGTEKDSQESSVRWGISLNLDRALSWVSDKKD
jgi:hypothetical protein